MEPVTLATASVSLVAFYLAHVGEGAAEKLGADLNDAARERLGQLYRCIKSKFGRDRLAEPLLQQLEQRPDSKSRQAVVAEIVTEAVEADLDFARDLDRLVRETREAGGDVIRITDAGAVALRGVLSLHGTYVAGRDMTINEPNHAEPQREP